MIDHDRKLKEFMGRKDQERTEAHLEMEAMRRKKGVCGWGGGTRRGVYEGS